MVAVAAASEAAGQVRADAAPSKGQRHELLPKRRNHSGVKQSMFVGVSWHKDQRKWRAIIKHGEKQHRLGCFDDDEREAARAFDLAARQLQADAAHSEKVGTKRLRLNFPTEEEVKRTEEKGCCRRMRTERLQQQHRSDKGRRRSWA